MKPGTDFGEGRGKTQDTGSCRVAQVTGRQALGERQRTEVLGSRHFFYPTTDEARHHEGLEDLVTNLYRPRGVCKQLIF